jgi:glycerol-3-phosphate dehydrogenase (NAD(P)+)
VIGGALSKLTDRGLIGPDELPLLRSLYAVIAEERPLAIPWSSFFGEAGAVTPARELAG